MRQTFFLALAGAALLGAALLGCDAGETGGSPYMRGTLEGQRWNGVVTYDVEGDSVESVAGRHDTADRVCPRTDPCALLVIGRWTSGEARPHPLRNVYLLTYQQDVVDISDYVGTPSEWPVRDEAVQGTLRCFTTGGPLYRDLRFAKRHALPDTVVFRDLRVCYDARPAV